MPHITSGGDGAVGYVWMQLLHCHREARSLLPIAKLRDALIKLIVKGNVVASFPEYDLSGKDLSLGTMGYCLPPKEIQDIVDAPPLAILSFSPSKDKILFFKRRVLPPLSDLAKPEEKLAGVRIDVHSNTRSRMSYTRIGIHKLMDNGTLGSEKEVHGYPEGARINFVTWSQDGCHLSFSVRVDEMWNLEKQDHFLNLLRYLNAIFDSFVWVNNSTFLVYTIHVSRGAPPQKPSVPSGPKIQSNETKNVVQVRTFQDLLKEEYDADLFDYYATSQLMLASLDGTVKQIGPPAVYTSIDPSPDDKYLMLSSLNHPYSYIVPCGRFPKKVELWTVDVKFIRELCDSPLAEDIPIAKSSLSKGKRSIYWKPDKPSIGGQTNLQCCIAPSCVHPSPTRPPGNPALKETTAQNHPSNHCTCSPCSHPRSQFPACTRAPSL